MTRRKLTQNEKRRGWIKFLFFMILLSFILFSMGFIFFALKVENLRPPSSVPKADGIVVWTGKGGSRLETGAQLLRQDKGERLLISGVNEKTSLTTIKDLLILSDEKAECCIDLDYNAEDTVGNARETASWAQTLGYEHILLVTSAYHMPRAEIEIGAAIGRVKITPYPVVHKDRQSWYADRPRFKRLFQEYGKLLLTYMREPASREKQGAPLLDQLPQEQNGDPKFLSDEASTELEPEKEPEE